jgi:aminoglycoside phosphotransferase (APT) family kinase protein
MASLDISQSSSRVADAQNPQATLMSAVASDLGRHAEHIGSIAAKLSRFIESECGAGSRVANFGPMEDGHAGLTFGFDVIGGASERLGSYVIKLAPIGVARRGNTDVYRQAPLLRNLHKAGMPVPAVPWASPDEQELGTPFIIMERLPGRIFFVWEPHASFPRETAAVRALWLQAAQLLARLHRTEWQTVLADWERPRGLRDELGAWVPLLRHAETPALTDEGAELHRLLAARIPDEPPTGIVHGDFQPGNILYVAGKANAVIDWELTSIGAQGLDVGWLMMLTDERAWPATCRPVAPVSRADLLEAYRHAGGPALADTDWYQALAQFRLGAIACLNVKLHRSGRRSDRFWERMAPAIPVLFARGIELVLGASKPSRGG